MRGRRSMTAEQGRPRSASAWDDAKAPPPTWTTRRSRGGAPSSASWSRSSQPSVAPALDGEAVEVALDGEGHGAACDGPEQTQVGGIARPGRPGARRPRAPRRGRAGGRGRAPRALGGTKTRSRRPAARATTAAASAALPQLAMAKGAPGSAWPRASATRRASRTPMRWRALCEPETLPVSSLTQRPPGACEAEARVQARRADERRGPEAVPVDTGDSVVELADEANEAAVAPPRGPGDVPGVEPGAVADEGVRVGLGVGPWTGRADQGGVVEPPRRGRGRCRRPPRPPGSGRRRADRRAARTPQPPQTSRLVGRVATRAGPDMPAAVVRGLTRRPRRRPRR